MAVLVAYASRHGATEGIAERIAERLRASVPREFPALHEAVHPRGERVFFGAMFPDAKPIGLADASSP